MYFFKKQLKDLLIKGSTPEPDVVLKINYSAFKNMCLLDFCPKLSALNSCYHIPILLLQGGVRGYIININLSAQKFIGYHLLTPSLSLLTILSGLFPESFKIRFIMTSHFPIHLYSTGDWNWLARSGGDHMQGHDDIPSAGHKPSASVRAGPA